MSRGRALDLHSRNAFLRLATCLVLATLLVSCADADRPEGAAPSPDETQTPAEAREGEEYRSIDALASDLKQGGLECTDLIYPEQENPGLKEFALCDPEKDPLQRINIYLFKTAEVRDSYIGSIVQSGLPWLLGPNWITVAAGEPATAEERLAAAQQAIGGQTPDVQLEEKS